MAIYAVRTTLSCERNCPKSRHTRCSHIRQFGASIGDGERIGRQDDDAQLLLRHVKAGIANEQAKVLKIAADPLKVPVQIFMIEQTRTPVASRKGSR